MAAAASNVVEVRNRALRSIVTEAVEGGGVEEGRGRTGWSTQIKFWDEEWEGGCRGGEMHVLEMRATSVSTNHPRGVGSRSDRAVEAKAGFGWLREYRAPGRCRGRE